MRPVALSTLPMNSLLPASRMPGAIDGMWSPVSARLRSLRRLLSRGKQAVVGISYSHRHVGDIEQGLAGAESSARPRRRRCLRRRTDPDPQTWLGFGGEGEVTGNWRRGQGRVRHVQCLARRSRGEVFPLVFEFVSLKTATTNDGIYNMTTFTRLNTVLSAARNFK
ncbi:unnamed protein product [Miscanthus lutarioriparius]|uniref:Uncharacterized protein n=1 Tax=Miscanthus lutarioriparius TaxID=422564 RepID=A0A811PTU5_9POAL|nr:unnamed protein product [Miscanthus lutarioriparius]